MGRKAFAHSKSLQAPCSTHITVNRDLFMRWENWTDFPPAFLTIVQLVPILETRHFYPLCSQYLGSFPYSVGNEDSKTLESTKAKKQVEIY